MIAARPRQCYQTGLFDRLSSLSSASNHSAKLADLMGSCGYVVLAIDSLTPRGSLPIAAASLSSKRSMPMGRYGILPGRTLSTDSEWPFLASRWAALRRLTRWIAVLVFNILQSGFISRSGSAPLWLLPCLREPRRGLRRRRKNQKNTGEMDKCVLPPPFCKCELLLTCAPRAARM